MLKKISIINEINKIISVSNYYRGNCYKNNKEKCHADLELLKMAILYPKELLTKYGIFLKLKINSIIFLYRQR